MNFTSKDLTIEKKIKGLPHVYYFNLDADVYRKELMESQFDRYRIKEYTRISQSNYIASEHNDWNDKVIGEYHPEYTYILGNFLTHIEFLKHWYESTQDEYLLIMEDDYDLGIIDYWHFTWEYLINRLPYDWDCIQLGYENPKRIRFFLSPRSQDEAEEYFGPCLLNRDYVKKILKLFVRGDKIKIDNYYNSHNNDYNVMSHTVDYAISFNGKTYTIPLITTNTDLLRDERKQLLSFHYTVRDTYYYWWENKRDLFTLDDFFTFNKPYDSAMTELIQ